jgi:hypothetical protein
VPAFELDLTKLSLPEGRYMILYEEVDETEVDLVPIL